MGIIEQIKDYFRGKGLKQSEIANECGWKNSFVSELLNGKRTIGDETAIKLNKVYGFNLHWLLTGEGSMFSTDTPAESKEASGADQQIIEEYKEEVRRLKEQLAESNRTISNLNNYISILESRKSINQERTPLAVSEDGFDYSR